jgi:arylsulfatase A-like enzyme
MRAVCRLAPFPIGLLGLLAACAGGGGEDPNLLLVTLDTTRADALSCYGAAAGTTPALDALAESGVLFENAYSASNVTKPSHLSLLSGTRAIRHRVFSNHVLIPEEVVPLPLLLERRGYATAAFVGAVQLGEGTAWRGFGHVDGPQKAQRDGARVVDGAVKWLRDHEAAEPDRPFFLWVHLFDPHTLYSPPENLARRFYEGDPRAGDGPALADEPFLEGWNYPPMKKWIRGIRDREYAPAMYAAEIAYTDGLVGRLLRRLEDSAFAEDTAVVLTADHGESLGEHGIFYDHAGLFEPSLRVPLLVRWPGIEGERRVDDVVTLLDVVPTLADLMGFGLPASADGRSLRPLLENTGPADAPEAFVFEAAHNHHVAVRRGRWKAIWTNVDDHHFFTTEPRLYDLEADPGETRNVHDEHPDVVAELEVFAAPWRALGVVAKGDLPVMSDDVQAMLDDLGYAGDD